MAWHRLVIAGLFEVVWAFSMKQSEGFTRSWPSIVTLAAALASFALLSWSLRSHLHSLQPKLEAFAAAGASGAAGGEDTCKSPMHRPRVSLRRRAISGLHGEATEVSRLTAFLAAQQDMFSAEQAATYR